MGSSALDLKMAARFWFLSLLVFVGLECRAQANQFKCGIFFGNLRNDIIWIGAVPDAIPGVRRRGGEQLVREVFPRANGKTLSAAYFTQWKNTCDAKEANDRCYLLFSSKRSEP